MSGWLTNGLYATPNFTGLEQFPLDTELAAGAAPETVSASLIEIATAIQYLTNNASKTVVAGSRYYRSLTIGASGGVAPPTGPRLITGVNVLIGGTGGTDKWLAELHDANGVLLATSAVAGVTVGTAGTWQQFAFTAAYSAAPGNYFVTIQTNGTTATLACFNSPTSPLITGSATGTFGTGANFTPATTYTADLGPVAQLYI